jgi:integrase
MAKRKAWSKSFGPYGCRVRVYERAGAASMLYLEIRRKGEPPAYEALGHRDRGRGTEQARERQAQIELGQAENSGRGPTLGALLDAYAARQGERGDLRASARTDTARGVTYWKAMLGPDRDAVRLTLDDVERACERRRTGSVNARGETVQPKDRRPVRARAIGADLELLRAAFRWALLKRRMLRENPLAGLEIPEEPNVRRPLATADRFDATRVRAGEVTMELRGEGKRIEVPSYLVELLDLAYSTGRRIGAICQLRYEDLLLDVQPFGALRWSADSDKMGAEWTAEIDERARAAVDRILVDREVGLRAGWKTSPWLFPSPRNPARAVSKDLVSDWLERAEQLAQLPKLDGSLWHAYRRGWATARKHHPLADVAAAGGWKTKETLSRIYQQPDAASTRRAILEPRELRG